MGSEVAKKQASSVSPPPRGGDLLLKNSRGWVSLKRNSARRVRKRSRTITGCVVMLGPRTLLPAPDL